MKTFRIPLPVTRTAATVPMSPASEAECGAWAALASIDRSAQQALRFARRLPALLPGMAPRSAAAAEGPGDGAAGRPCRPGTLAPARILLVDDDPVQVLIASRLLTRLGYAVTSYADPVQALQVFEAEPQAFDAVVMDRAMPVMTGFDASELMLRTRPNLPILMVTGYLNPQDRELADRIGIREVLLKPYRAEQVDASLRRLVAA